MLEVRGVVKRFGGLLAVSNVDLDLLPGEILGLVGPNGAGKTTLLNLIAGVYRPDAGTIRFNGEDITKMAFPAVCQRGIVKTFQHPAAFPGLSAVECVMVGELFGVPHRITMEEAREQAYRHLRFVQFPADKADSLPGSLNVMELKRVQLARALATRPRLLLLDELTTGLTHREGTDAIALLRKVRDNGVTILLIEHVMRVILGVSDRMVVLDHGEKIADGKPADVVQDPRVITSYLGQRSGGVPP